ncbi:MAG: phytanoyl-CoA dioxygenase family protein, partial [bacterium]
MESTLTPAEREFWEKNHYLVRKGAYAGPALAALLAWADELAAWPESPGQWMKYFERTAQNDRQLCRIENFLEFHESLRDIIQGDEALATLAELMGEEAVLFKEKINYKLPGGAGFLAHQDAPAFTSFQQRYHVTMLVTVDAMTISNGCLEVGGAVPVYEILPQEADGTVAKEEEEARD